MAIKLSPPFKTPVLMGAFFSKAWELFWRDIINRQEIVIDTFTTDGTTNEFTLSVQPLDVLRTQAFVNGSYQRKSVYSIERNRIIFGSAPASGWLEVTTYGR